MPEVQDVSLGEVVESSYTYNDKVYEAYKVDCSWTYVEDFDYQTSTTLTIIKDGTKLYVVESA